MTEEDLCSVKREISQLNNWGACLHPSFLKTELTITLARVKHGVLCRLQIISLRCRQSKPQVLTTSGIL